MRRQTIALLAAALLLWTLPAVAKMYRSPISFSEDVASLEKVDRRELSRLDNGDLLVAAERREARRALGGPARFAEPREVDYTLTNSGTWETLSDGSRIGRAHV